MWISCIKLSKVLIVFSIILSILLCSISCYFLFFKKTNSSALSLTIQAFIKEQNNHILENKASIEENMTSENKENNYIKWFEFNPTYDVLLKTATLDINSHTKNEAIKYNWIELISYLACKYGNDFKKFKQVDLDKLITRLKSGETMETITKDMKLYSYYYEGYSTVLSEFIGKYEVQKPNKNTTSSNEATLPFTTIYGFKAFHPLAQNYSYSHYNDFGNSRSYGYKRLHLGNDLMGSIGTPVIAVESRHYRSCSVGINMVAGE